MCKLRASGENLNRCEARNVLECEPQPLLEGAGLDWSTPLAGQHNLLHASQPLPLRAFSWVKFHLTACKQKRQRYGAHWCPGRHVKSGSRNTSSGIPTTVNESWTHLQDCLSGSAFRGTRLDLITLSWPAPSCMKSGDPVPTNRIGCLDRLARGRVAYMGKTSKNKKHRKTP